LEDQDQELQEAHCPAEADDWPREQLPSNIYGFAIGTMIQDAAYVEQNPSRSCYKRLLRIISGFALCWAMFALQSLLILETKRLVTPREVKNARAVYGQYEYTMYTDNQGMRHTFNTSNGFARGIKGNFNASNWARMSDKDKIKVCNLPLSQPIFCFSILFIWVLTVLMHMRVLFNTTTRILCALDTCASMKDALRKQSETEVIVVALPCWMKTTIVLGMQLPRVFMNSLLAWLGCRYLVATVEFGDLLLNAVALEFVLNLPILMYEAMVPHSSKLIVQQTCLPHIHHHEDETCVNMFGMFCCGLFAAIVVYVYMFHAQLVLPAYNWDVNRVCSPWLEKALAV
jgi:hypothetical protein